MKQLMKKKLVSCSVCFKYCGPTNLKRHEKKCRQNYVKNIGNHYSLPEENKNHIPRKMKEYSCEHCATVFKNKKSLSSHIRFKHGAQITCPHCEKNLHSSL